MAHGTQGKGTQVYVAANHIKKEKVSHLWDPLQQQNDTLGRYSFLSDEIVVLSTSPVSLMSPLPVIERIVNPHR